MRGALATAAIIPSLLAFASQPAVAPDPFPPPPVNRGITVAVQPDHSPVKLLLTDPLSRMDGFDFKTGVNVATIPTSLLLESDWPAIFINDGIPGTYTVQVLGRGTGGTFGLDIAYPNAFPNTFDTTIEEYSGTILPGQKLTFTFDAFVFRDVAYLFTAFGAQLRVTSASKAFELNGTFTVPPGRMISPVSQPLTILLGHSFLVTIPAGSLRRTPQGTFVFAGMIRGIPLVATLTPLDGNSYAFRISGSGAPNLPVVANPIDVRLAIGYYGGSVSLNTDFGPQGP